MEEALAIKRFDAGKVSTPFSAVILGNPARGKTTLAIDLIRRMNTPVDHVCVWGKGDGANLPNFPDDMDVCEFSDYEFLEKIFATQCEGAKAIRDSRQSDKQGKNGLKHICVVLEDFHDEDFFKSRIARELLMNGRHMNISLLILMMPNACEIPRGLRVCIDLCFMAKMTASETPMVHSQFFEGVKSEQDFTVLMESCCAEAYNFLVVDNTTHTDVLSECITWYKASPAPASAIASYRAKIDALCSGADDTIGQGCSVDAM